ncbi:hypothetical protein DUNSADRAFT_12771 [Dunaliella salina]|uniref:Uncharacterized protein n=1 Tax=Dunaliella salina TaxID=3046 RepID=A0ABQ7GAL1_DUNSA|nr:hypothetical protein DUNSADRAFT_12771 [Dunaliella salina]|eukprot:KAF5831643.1 hypothetical protein DUNSADRAFT_12771 [Dunaliella salina]
MEANQNAHALQVRPRLLLFVCVFLSADFFHATSGAVTPEHEARAQKLLQDNLKPTLAFWENLRAAHGGRKLTMQSFFKLVHSNVGSRFTGFWGIKDNKVFQLDKEGELRYDKELMIKEGKPNRGAAESLKASFWLAVEDASKYGVRLPDCVFVYNAADSPMCGQLSRINCSDYTYAPTLSIMSLNSDIMRKLRPASPPKLYPDLLVPLFSVTWPFHMSMWEKHPASGRFSMLHLAYNPCTGPCFQPVDLASNKGYKSGLQPGTLADRLLGKQSQPALKIETNSDKNFESLYES